MALRSLFIIALVLVPTLAHLIIPEVRQDILDNSAQEVLRKMLPTRKREKELQKPEKQLQLKHKENPVAMSANNDKTFEGFKNGALQDMFKPDELAALSKECSQAAEAVQKEREMTPPPRIPYKRCEHTPCVGRMEMTTKGGVTKHAEGPMCLPKECMNSADQKVISAQMQEKMSKLMKDAKITLELDCTAAGGADKGAGGDREITVEDDYLHDAQPLPSQGHPAARRTNYKSEVGRLSLTPLAAVAVLLVNFFLP